MKYLPLFHHLKAIYQFPKHIMFLVKIVANASLNKTLNLNLNLKRLDGDLSGPRTPSPIVHAPSNLTFIHPLHSHWIFFWLLSSFIIIILDFIFLILHQCKYKYIQICVYISFLERQHNFMLFYIKGQQMGRYIHFVENITRRLTRCFLPFCRGINFLLADI